MSLELCDEFEGGFGWTEPGFLERTSHALGVSAEGSSSSTPSTCPGSTSGSAPSASPRRSSSFSTGTSGIRRRSRLGSAFRIYGWSSDAHGGAGRLVRIVWNRVWKEVAFWEPERRVLVVADALGTVGYFTAPGEAIGVHPLLRLRPPRDLGELEPEHILCGHGAGVHGPAAAVALREALATSRRRLPRALASGLRRRKS